MKKSIFIFICFLFVFAGNKYDKNELERPINLKSLHFEFFPCHIKDPIIILDYTSIKKFNDSEIVVVCEKVKYTWKNKSVLYMENKNLGCYNFLCIKWDFGYEFVY